MGPEAARPLRWLHLDLNSYFASVEQQVRPELRGRPIAVGPADVPSGTIIAASVEAKRFGVATGLKVGEARRRCPELVITPARHSLYVEYHERIVAEVWRHIPVAHVCSIDEVACRLLDNENAPDHALALARRIKAGIRARVGECLTASVGIAPNRLVAKIASDMVKPDGLVLVTGSELPQRLFGLPLRAVPGIGAKTAARLAARGLHSVEDYCRLEAARAGRALGAVTGDRLWWRLHGHDFPDAAPKSKSIGHSHVLAPQRREPSHIRRVARRLLAGAATRLRAGGYATPLLALHARFEGDGGDWSKAVRLAPTDDSFALLEALDRLWPELEATLADRATRVRTIGIQLMEVRPAQADQLSLFAHLDAQDPLARATRTGALSRAMDRLNARFGRGAVTLGAPLGGRADRVGSAIAFGRIPERDGG